MSKRYFLIRLWHLLSLKEYDKESRRMRAWYRESSSQTIAGEDVTGGKVAVTRQERETRGLSPVEQKAYKLAPEAYQEGKSKVESNDIDPRRIAESVANNPRPLSYSETGALIYDRARLKNEQRAIYERITSATSDVQAGRS
jgi:hypothetical protein